MMKYLFAAKAFSALAQVAFNVVVNLGRKADWIGVKKIGCMKSALSLSAPPLAVLLVATAFALITAPSPAMAWPFGGSDPSQEFQDDLKDWRGDYESVLEQLAYSSERLKSDPDRVVGEIEGMIGVIDEILAETSAEGNLRERVDAAYEFYSQRRSDAVADETMSPEQRREAAAGWEQKMMELRELWKDVQARHNMLAELREVMKGDLEYAVHMEQLQQAEKLHTAVRKIIGMMDSAIARLQGLGPSPVS
jgi:hypothetical protein